MLFSIVEEGIELADELSITVAWLGKNIREKDAQITKLKSDLAISDRQHHDCIDKLHALRQEKSSQPRV